MTDIVERLRQLNLKYGDQAAYEIERLREQLAAVTKTLDETAPWRELQAENKRLTKERDELVAALTKIGEIASPYRDGVKFNYIADIAQAALAKAERREAGQLGADKTGEK